MTQPATKAEPINALVEVETLKAVEVYGNGRIDSIIDQVEREARAHKADISTPAGRKAVASIAHKVARSKTALDTMGKELTEEARQTINAVNEERKRVRDRLDALKDEVRAPLTNWENAEKNRVADLENRVARLHGLTNFESIPDSKEIEEAITLANSLYQHDWQEFQGRADTVWSEVKARLETMLAERKQYEAEQEELERLRKEQEERRIKEEREQIAREAAEKAKREAEERAAAERAEAERKAQAERDEYNRQKREAEEREAAAKAENERLKALAEQERIAAKQREEEAAKRERERIEAEKQAELEAIAKREADVKHRKAINRAAVTELVKCGINEKQAQDIITAIYKGDIPNVSITY